MIVNQRIAQKSLNRNTKAKMAAAFESINRNGGQRRLQSKDQGQKGDI